MELSPEDWRDPATCHFFCIQIEIGPVLGHADVKTGSRSSGPVVPTRALPGADHLFWGKCCGNGTAVTTAPGNLGGRAAVSLLGTKIENAPASRHLLGRQAMGRHRLRHAGDRPAAEGRLRYRAFPFMGQWPRRGLAESLRADWLNAEDFAKGLAVARAKFPEPLRKTPRFDPPELRVPLLEDRDPVEPPEPAPRDFNMKQDSDMKQDFDMRIGSWSAKLVSPWRVLRQ